LAKAITLKDGEEAETVSETERIRRAFGMTEWDPRPTLLYFHFPHEDDGQKRLVAGKETLKQCRELDDGKVARWSNLMNGVEVDVTDSAKELIKRFGVEDKPCFAIIDRDLNVIATSKATSRKNFIAFVKKALPKFEAYWQTIEERLTDQKQSLEEARAFVKKKDLRRALNRYQDVRTSDLRIADFWDDARKEADKLEKKIHEEG